MSLVPFTSSSGQVVPVAAQLTQQQNTINAAIIAQERARVAQSIAEKEAALSTAMAVADKKGLNAYNKTRALSGLPPMDIVEYKHVVVDKLTNSIQQEKQQLAALQQAIETSTRPPMFPQLEKKYPRAVVAQQPSFESVQRAPVIGEAPIAEQYESLEDPLTVFRRVTGRGPATYEYDMRRDLEQRINAQLPSGSYKFVATVKLTVKRADAKGVVRTYSEKVRVADPIVVDPGHRRAVINTFMDKIFTYDYTKDGGILISAAVDDISFTVIWESGKQRVINVAKYAAGNCVIKILEDDPNIGKVYARLPHLKVGVDDKVSEMLLALGVDKPTYDIFIEPEELQVVATVLKKKIVVYTKLGAIFDAPWCSFGNEKAKRIEMVFGNGHANIRGKDRGVKSITYVTEEELAGYNQDGGRVDVIECGYGAKGSVTYSLLSSGVLVKAFRVSSVTGDPADDLLVKWARVVTREQVLTIMFKKEHGIRHIEDEFIREITRLSEHFIGRRVFSCIDSECVEADMNANYVAYKRSAEYIGFPTDDLYPSVECSDSMFMVVATGSGKPLRGPTSPSAANGWKAFEMLLGSVPASSNGTGNGIIVLPAPTVAWLRKQGCVVNVLYTLAGKAKDIDINEFCHKVGGDKSFRNSLIGRVIAGGVSETKKISVGFSDVRERDQLIFEAGLYGCKYELFESSIVVHYKARTRAAFHFHSFILSYAFCLMADALMGIFGCSDVQVHGVNVDAIFYSYTGEDPTVDHMPGSRLVGEWKRLIPSEYWRNMDVSENKVIAEVPGDSAVALYRTTRNRPINIGLIGAPGIGKSYPFVSMPWYDQILLTPTCVLAAEHSSTIERLSSGGICVTAEKYFQTNVSEADWMDLRARGVIPRRRKVVVIDEACMFSIGAFSKMLHRATIDSSIVILLFDPEQISNELEGGGIVELIRSKMPVAELPRVYGAVCRHSWEEGLLFDSLRGLSAGQQVEVLSEYVPSVSIGDIELVEDNIHVTGSHVKCKEINLLYRGSGRKMIRVKEKKKGMFMVPVDSELIWWGRESIKDEMPAGFKYEPCFSVTVDSLQGSTFVGKMYVDTGLRRRGCFYTAVTRVKSISQLFLVVG